MINVYSVKPGSNEIRVSDGRTIVSDSPITWGEKLKSIEMAQLCRLILNDVLEDATEADRLAHRFKWRTVMTWDKDKPHAITEDEVRAVVKAIREVEVENAPHVAKVSRERPTFVSDAPLAGQVYDSNPDITPNKPKEKENGN